MLFFSDSFVRFLLFWCVSYVNVSNVLDSLLLLTSEFKFSLDKVQNVLTSPSSFSENTDALTESLHIFPTQKRPTFYSVKIVFWCFEFFRIDWNFVKHIFFYLNIYNILLSAILLSFFISFFKSKTNQIKIHDVLLIYWCTVLCYHSFLFLLFFFFTFIFFVILSSSWMGIFLLSLRVRILVFFNKSFCGSY